MNKQQSKSNILFHEKKQTKSSLFTLKSKKKKLEYPQEKCKVAPETKKPKTTQKQPKSNKNTLLKSKIQLQKSSHPKHSQKPDHPPIYSGERKNSASIVSQRAPSRLSNKRSSVISTKSNKFVKDDEHKENDQNKNNIHDIQIHENECIIDELKKSMKNTKSKKKLSLNINSKQRGQLFERKETHKNGIEKSGKIQMFEKKMSNYLNQKDIFSEQFLHETNSNKNKSKKNLKAKSKQNMELNLEKSKKATEKENLLENYQFYKKTFDINLNNCMRKGSNGSKDAKSRKTTSTTNLKPSQSSTLIFKKQTNLKFADPKMDLCEKKNGSNCSNGSKSQSESKQTLSKSRKNESRSIYDKENRLLSHIKMSSLLQSRSKSRNSMINHSQSSTKDHIFSYQVERQCANSTLQEASLKRSKNSYKQLMVFNENQVKTNRQELNPKNYHKFKYQVDDVKEMSKLSNQRNQEKFFNKQDKSEVIDSKKIEVGQSNIDVLKWWSNNKRSLSTSIIKHLGINEEKCERVQEQSQLFKKKQSEKSRGLTQIPCIHEILEEKGIQNLVPMEFLYQKYPQIIQQEYSPQKLTKKKSEQISSLGDLSSISSIHDSRDQHSNMKQMNPIVFEMEDAAFQL